MAARGGTFRPRWIQPVPAVLVPGRAPPSSGSAALTLAAITASSAGKVQVKASLSVTLAGATGGAAGKVQVKGTASVAAADVGFSATGLVTEATVIRGALNQQLEATGISAAGTVAIAVAAAMTLDDAELVAEASSPVVLSGGGAVANIGSSAQGKVQVKASFEATLGDATVAAEAAGQSRPQADLYLDAIGVSMDVRLSRLGSLSRTLGAVSVGAQGKVRASGAFSRQVAAVTVVSVVNSTGGKVKVYLEGEWHLKPVKYWTGTVWRERAVYHWSGTAWLIAKEN
jgi:hypothetical protein